MKKPHVDCSVAGWSLLLELPRGVSSTQVEIEVIIHTWLYCFLWYEDVFVKVTKSCEGNGG